MKNPVRVLGEVIMSVCLSGALTGCSTLVGYGLGSALDPGIPGASLRIPGEVDSLEAGTWVRIIRKDSSEVRGKIYAIKLERDSVSGAGNYPDVYEEWRATKEDGGAWPARYGTSVRLALRTTTGEKLYSGSFAGFDSMAVRLSLVPGSRVVSFDLGHVAELREAQGQFVADREMLMRTWKAGVPVFSTLKRAVVLNTETTAPILFDEIREVSRLEDGNETSIGLAIGIAADAIWWTFIAIALLHG